MQYPNVELVRLKKMFNETENIIFIDNEDNFKESLSKYPYDALFTDNFAKGSGFNFGHATPYGNQLIAENVANVVLKEIENSQHSSTFITTKDKFFYLNDTYFLPIGENVAWLSYLGTYEYYFKRLNENGANTVRLIMVPWDTDIEWNLIGSYDAERIKKLDRIIELAKKYNLYVILSFDIYGELRTESQDPREMLWKENPYNKLNGGPIENPEKFFTNKEAKEHYKERIKFIVSRYKNNPNIFAYELWNEADITDNFNLKNYLKWQDEMVDFIKNIDSNHLVSSSFANPNIENKVWKNLDFIQIHYHDNDVLSKLPELIAQKNKLKKPIIFSEFSLGNNAEINKKDEKGETLHDALWISSMNGVGTMPWWWDEYIEENNLYYHFGALSNFWDDVQLNSDYKVKDIKLECNNCSYFSLFNSSQGFMFINNINTNFSIFLIGEYNIEYWNTYSGKIILNETFSENILVPYFEKDIALKIKKII